MRDYKALIRQKRQEKGISQNQLAKLVGISQPYMNQIETGVRNPTLPTLMKICEILDISLFGKEDEETGGSVIAIPCSRINSGLPARICFPSTRAHTP